MPKNYINNLYNIKIIRKNGKIKIKSLKIKFIEIFILCINIA